MRILAIDPSLRCTGYAVLEEVSKGVKVVEFGEIRNAAKLPVSSCLVAIHDEIARLIQTYEPECGAMEAVIYVQSFRTAIVLGSARGVAMFAMAARGLPVYEYAPRSVKQAVVGRGGAVKTQVSFMVRALLGLQENPPPDAADAMAVGLAHFQARQAALRGAGPLEGDMSVRVEWLGRMDFGEALALQEEAVAGKAAGAQEEDILFLLEHLPVYTIGRTPDQTSLLDSARLPHPVVRINRGGQATYHGPGQLVGYPIMDLRRHGQDLHRYLRSLEEVLILTLEKYGVRGSRREGLTGVWVGERKIASIGVGVRRWISMHGFALNVRGDLAPFQKIVPCGIAGVEITSIARETGVSLDLEEVGGVVGEIFQAEFSAYLS